MIVVRTSWQACVISSGAREGKRGPRELGKSVTGATKQSQNSVAESSKLARLKTESRVQEYIRRYIGRYIRNSRVDLGRRLFWGIAGWLSVEWAKVYRSRLLPNTASWNSNAGLFSNNLQDKSCEKSQKQKKATQRWSNESLLLQKGSVDERVIRTGMHNNRRQYHGN